MSRFQNRSTGAIFSVDDSKDHRYAGEGFDLLDSSATPTSKYSDLSYADLKAEIGRRNEGRDDTARLSPKGKSADLVAALEADDIAQADSDPSGGDDSTDE